MKIFTKIIGVFLGLTMAAGVGIGVVAGNTKMMRAEAATSSDWTKVTGTLVANTEYLIVSVSDDACMKPTNTSPTGTTTTNTGNYASTTFSSSSAPNNGFIFEDAGNGKFYIKDGTRFVYASGTTNNGLGSKNTAGATDSVWTATDTGNGVYTLITDSSRQLSKYSTNWRVYATNSSSRTNVHIYSRVGSAAPFEPEHAGTLADPYSVADARGLIDDSQLLTNVYVTGIVCNGGSSLSDGKMNYYISDDGSTTNKFELYKGKNLNNTDFASTSDILVGDTVVVKGTLKKYNSTYELDEGNILISLSRPTQYTISYDANGGEGTMLDTTGTNPTVAACEFTYEGYDFVRWNTQADGNGTNYNVGDAPEADLTLYAIWQEHIEEYHLEYTLGTKSSDCTVNGHNGIKVGTSGDDGDMSITIPSGVTKIKLYIAAWKDKAGTVTLSGVISDTLTLSADSGITGNSPFTLNGAEANFKVELTVTSGTLTITSGTARRFVVWGATDKFASDFVTAWGYLTCDSTGVTPPTIGGGHSWTTFKTIYNSLDAEEKGIILANSEITAKYDYIVGKYGYEDFMHRNPPAINQAKIVNLINTNSNSIILVIVLSMVILTSIGGILIIRKKKEN